MQRGLPLLQAVREGGAPGVLQEGFTQALIITRLVNDCLMQRQTAVNKVFVTGVQPREQRKRRDAGGFAVFAAVTAATGEHQIPDAIQVNARQLCRERQEVVDIGKRRVMLLKADGRVAVKTVAFLVAVQAVATARQRDAR